MAEKGKAIPSTPAIHTIEPRDFCLFSTFLHFVRCFKKAILSGIHNAPGKSLGLFAYRTSKGCCHRRNATGRFLGVVGFLFENPQHLFFYQDFSV